MLENFKTLLGGASWATTVFGFVAGVASYLAALGPNIPVTGSEWASALVSAALVALGYKAK